MRLLYFLLSAIKCPEPVPDADNADVDVLGVHYSHSVNYTCVGGFATVADTLSPDQEVQTMTCLADGTWGDVPVDCDHSKIGFMVDW